MLTRHMHVLLASTPVMISYTPRYLWNFRWPRRQKVKNEIFFFLSYEDELEHISNEELSGFVTI